MSSPETPLTLDDIMRVPWQEAIADITERDCWNYCSRFCARAADADKADDEKTCDVYALLARVTSLTFTLDRPDTPLGPPDRLDSFTEPELTLLAALVPTITDPEMQARVADVLWLRNHGEAGRRDYRLARIAVGGYLASARQLEDPHDWVLGMDRVERALQLAASLGKSPKNTAYRDVIDYVEEVLDRYKGEDPLFLSARMMELLQEQRQGNPVKYAVLAEKAARRAEEAHNWDLARTYWERKARWHEIAKDEEQRRAATIAAAETYIRDADERIAASGANHLTAAVLYQDGIEALRRVGGMQERVTQLHKALLAYQEKGVSEMGRFSAVVTIDNIEDYMERARAQVRGRPLPDALLALAFVASPPKVSTIEQHIKETLKQSPVWDIFPRTLVNERGRTQKRIPTSSSGPEGERAALETEMFGYAVELRRARVLTSIEPAREQVNLDHNVRVRDFAPLIVNNAFVPIGREGIFARGLHAGLVGDFLVATHLLIPQLDHSIRTALESRGAIVSGLEDDGTQPERGLNTTLAHAEATLVLGEDIVFDLRGLLVEKAGSNMRHAVAHGLVDEGAFHTTEAAYIWWISLHLCTLGRIQGPGGSDAG